MAKTVPRAKRAAKARTVSEVLDDADPPSRGELARLRGGTEIKPKEHWIPVPVQPQSPKLVFFKEVSRVVAERWKELGAGDRVKYVQQAEEDKGRFTREVDYFFSNRSPEQFYQQKLPSHLAKLDPLKPPKAPAGAYALFVKGMSEETPGTNLRALSQIASARWKGMTEAERHPWVLKGEEAKLLYLQFVDEYRKKLPRNPASS